MFAAACAFAAACCAAAAVLELAATSPRARRMTRWGGTTNLLAVLGRRSRLRLPVAADLGVRLAAAGLSGRFDVADVMAVKAGGAVAALALAAPLAPAAPGRLAVVLLLAAPAAGFLAPDFWLGRRTRTRAVELRAALPDVLDMLRVAVAAGMPLDAALRAVGARRAGLLAAELAATGDGMALGLERSRALARLQTRCPLPGIRAFVAAAERTGLHGAPLAPALAAIAADARAQRARARHERAARAAPKIQLVVALLLVPAAMLLLGAGMVASFA